jgi:hypothetical protein
MTQAHQHQMNHAPIVMRPVADLVVGPRLRESVGDLRGLMKSLQQRGLIHPLVIRDGHLLLCGKRRLEAARRLGWSTIATRNVEDLTPHEILELELDENGQRRDLTAYERSKQRVAEIQRARRDAEEEANSGGNSAKNSPRKHAATGKKTGPKGRKSGAQRDVAKRTGYSRKDQTDAADHIAFADRWPFLKAESFATSQVLAIKECLEGRFAATEHAPIMEWAEADEWEPHLFVAGLTRLSDLPVDRRARLLMLAKETPSRASAILFTETTLPDPGLGLFSKAMATIRQARKEVVCKAILDRLDRMVDEGRQLYRDWDALDAERRADELSH